MDYKKIYDCIINKRLTNIPNGYTEKHHIIPKSIGGSDSKENLVSLTAREHFIAHLLLSKMFPEGSVNWIKMQKALLRMYSVSIGQKRISPSKWYAYACERAAKAAKLNQTGSGNSQYGKIWIHNKTLKKSTSVKKEFLDMYVLEGWDIGRVINWNPSQKVHIIDLQKVKEREEKKKKEFEEKVKLYTGYYQIYNSLGWKDFVKITGYDKSKPNLVSQFKKYVKEFVPQNGKKRGC